MCVPLCPHGMVWRDGVVWLNTRSYRVFARLHFEFQSMATKSIWWLLLCAVIRFRYGTYSPLVCGPLSFLISLNRWAFLLWLFSYSLFPRISFNMYRHSNNVNQQTRNHRSSILGKNVCFSTGIFCRCRNTVVPHGCLLVSVAFDSFYFKRVHYDFVVRCFINFAR